MPIVELTLDSSGALVGAKQYDQATTQVAASTEKADTSISKMRASVNKIGPVLMAAGAAVGTVMVGVAAKTVQLASDLEETTNKFNVVFAGMEETANSWADSLRENYMMTTEESRRFLGSTQDLLKPMGVAAEEAGKMSFETAKLAADLGSFNNLTTAEVMDKIQSALVGNYESMKSLGVVMNKTKVEANAYATGIAKVGEELTQAQIAQSALDLIMKGSKDAQGDMARSAGSYALQMKQLQTNITELGTKIGTVLLPFATQVVTMLNDWLLKQGGLNLLLNGSISIIQGVANAYFGIVLALKAVIVAIGGFATFTVKAFRTVMKPIDLLFAGIEKLGGPKNPFNLVQTALEEFTASAVENFTKSWETTETFNKKMGDLKTTVDETVPPVKQLGDAADELSGGMGDATLKGQQLNDELDNTAEKATQAAEALDQVKGVYATMAETIVSNGREITNTYQMKVNAAGEWEKTLIGTKSAIIETQVAEEEAAISANNLAAANTTAKASYDQLASSASAAGQAIATTGSTAAAASAGGSSGGGGTTGPKVSWTELPAWFTEDMEKEYARFATSFATTASPINGKNYGPGFGGTWNDEINAARDRYNDNQLDPEKWAARYGYQQAQESSGVVVNVNNSMSSSELAALIAELERAQARQ